MRRGQKLIRDIVYYFVLTIYKVSNFLPLRFCFAMGSIFGIISYYILRTEKRRALTHLELVYGTEKSKREIRTIARENFKKIGINVMENICMKRIAPLLNENVTVEGLENVETALRNGRGLIWVTGHLGNWEIMPVYFSTVLKYPVSVIAAPLYDERLTEFVKKWRELFSVETIIRGGLSSYRMIREAFSKNKILGLLIDQDTRVPGVFVDFFGRKAYTPRGAVELALKFKAPIVVGFCRRRNRFSHEIKVYSYNIAQGNDYEDTILKNTQALTTIIEKEIASRPEDWVWMHRRWKRRPQN
jgi:KDO2-lipid IV(A) lauroyltransferase